MILKVFPLIILLLSIKIEGIILILFFYSLKIDYKLFKKLVPTFKLFQMKLDSQYCFL